MIDFHTQPVSGWMELTSASTSEVIEDRPVVVGKQVKTLVTKALRSKLLTEDLSRFSSRNEFFEISEIRIGHHFFEVFGKIGKMTLPS